MNLPPNEFVKVTDNAEAQLLMLQLGILDAVLKAEKAQQAKALKQSGTTVLDHNHPTHWIIAETYHGFADAEDNGYAVVCIPKSKFNRAEFDQRAALMTSMIYRGEVSLGTTHTGKYEVN